MTDLERKVHAAMSQAIERNAPDVDGDEMAEVILRALADAEVRIVPAAEEDAAEARWSTFVAEAAAKPQPTYEQRVTALEKARQLVPGSATLGGAGRSTSDYLTVASWLLGEHNPSTWRGADD